MLFSEKLQDLFAYNNNNIKDKWEFQSGEKGCGKKDGKERKGDGSLLHYGIRHREILHYFIFIKLVAIKIQFG